GRQVRAAAGGIPILFTRRHVREGGEAIEVGEEQVLEIYEAVCASRVVDLVDFEMDNDPSQLRAMQAAAAQAGTKVVLSFHDFRATPSVDAMVERFERAYTLGADIAEIAVIPQSNADVLALMSA